VQWENRLPVNGQALTSADVKYAFERALKKSPYASLLGPVQKIETPDRCTVRVHLSDGFAPLVHNLAQPWTAILPPEVEDRAGDFTTSESMIGCGPFVLERYEPGVKAVFARNPGNYIKGLPYLDKVEWLFIKDRSTQLSLFRAGRLDIPFYDARIRRSNVASFKKSNPDYPVSSGTGWRCGAWPCAPTSRPSTTRGCGGPSAWPSTGRSGCPGTPRGRGTRTTARAGAAQRVEAARQGPGRGGEVPRARPGAGVDAPGRGRIPQRDEGQVHPLARLRPGVRGGPGTAGLQPQAGRRGAPDRQRGARQRHPRLLPGQVRRTTWGPSSIFVAVDGYLYNFFRTGQPNNRSRVSDTRLDVLLDVQRRDVSKSTRKKVIDGIQRYAAEQVYDVYTPCPKNVSSWTPWVKNYRPKNSFDRGAPPLEMVWPDRA
jgi:hypothetical protein